MWVLRFLLNISKLLFWEINLYPPSKSFVVVVCSFVLFVLMTKNSEGGTFLYYVGYSLIACFYLEYFAFFLLVGKHSYILRVVAHCHFVYGVPLTLR